MPFCPQCHAEYVEGKLECNECQIPLVAQLPPPDPPEQFSNTPTEVVYDAQDEVSALNVKDILEANGIPVWIRSFENVYYDGLMKTMTGCWGRLWAPVEFADQARALIAGMDEAD